LLFSYLYFLIFNSTKILFIEFLSYLFFIRLRRIQRVQSSPRNHWRFSCSWISRQSIAGCLLRPSKSPRNQIAARKKHWRQPMNKSYGDGFCNRRARDCFCSLLGGNRLERFNEVVFTTFHFFTITSFQC